MQIDLSKMQCVESRLSAVIGELACQIENISEQIKLITLYGGETRDLAELRKINAELTDKMRTVMKMKEAVKRIYGVYKSGEERVVRYIDEGPVKKREFKSCTLISDKTDFDWSIK